MSKHTFTLEDKPGGVSLEVSTEGVGEYKTPADYCALYLLGKFDEKMAEMEVAKTVTHGTP